MSPDAATPSIRLLGAVPATVRVSSTVNNPKILPKHLVDGSFDTAWNSVTGQLVGAWIEVSIDDAAIEQVKLTVGHTGKSAKGEDYFTMNPRIAEVSITDDGKPLGTFPLDIEKRELQAIAVKPSGTLRITVTKIEPGSRKKWREIAVSELEVWGTPQLGWVAPPTRIEPIVEVDGEPATAPDPCAGIEEARVAFGDPRDRDSPGPGGDDHSYPPTCEDLPLPGNVAQLAAPWKDLVAGCPVGDEIYGPKDCVVGFRSGNRVAEIHVQSSMAHDMIEVASLVETDVIPGDHKELVAKIKGRHTDFTFVCRDTPQLGCAGPLEAPDDAALKAQAKIATFDTQVTANAE